MTADSCGSAGCELELSGVGARCEREQSAVGAEAGGALVA